MRESSRDEIRDEADKALKWNCIQCPMLFCAGFFFLLSGKKIWIAAAHEANADQSIFFCNTETWKLDRNGNKLPIQYRPESPAWNEFSSVLWCLLLAAQPRPSIRVMGSDVLPGKRKSGATYNLSQHNSHYSNVSRMECIFGFSFDKTDGILAGADPNAFQKHQFFT